MKFSLVLSLAIGVSAASFRTRSIGVQAFDGEYSFHAADIPYNAPEGYETSVAFLDNLAKRSTEAMEVVPAGLERRYESVQALRRLQRKQYSPNDFFECANANPAPASADCGVIVKNVLATGNDLVVARSSCLVFTYRTCQAFFCSLCSTLTTSTDFIGNQLDTVDALCVADGKAGTIVGEESPQYQLGFTRAGSGLPNYENCS
ncbi:hypothetical protein B0T14DRAFT_570304 [Immersiella caudata]|uniref:Uncharacterized protein n=1 Tax=Immersiella caudata TaxID=314043 RepID=A0AA40BUR0_9PEZI|nr:hypothetical protein B0T14DRAFT_570304 [Immersiella caudata]